MRKSVAALLTGVVFATTCIPVHAIDLLGGLGLDSVISVSSGPAESSSLVNAGLGGGGGNVLDLNVGGSTPIATANVSTDGGGLNVGANVLNDTATANLGVGGGNGLVTAGVGVGNKNVLDINIGIGTPGRPGTPGAPGAPGAAGVNGTNANGINGINGTLNTASTNGRGVVCDGMPANQVSNLLQSTRFDSWTRASGVKVQPVAVCGDVRAWLTSQLSGSNLGAALRQAVQSDALVSASLSRTSYGADRVLAVKQSGSQLVVFVY